MCTSISGTYMQYVFGSILIDIRSLHEIGTKRHVCINMEYIRTYALTRIHTKHVARNSLSAPVDIVHLR